jgi:hypothetical protein
MRRRFRTFLCLLPLALGAATVYLLARCDLAGLDPESPTDPWPLTALDQDDGDEIAKAYRRGEAKQQVVGALLDGRLTLQQAACRFRDIDSDWPAQVRGSRPPYCATEEEWACQQVIIYVHVEFAIKRRAPAQAAEWVCRLEAELWGPRRPKGAPRLHPDRGPAGEPDH